MTIPQNQAVGLKLTSSLITAPSPRTVAQNPPSNPPRKKSVGQTENSWQLFFLLRAASCLDEFTAQESQKPDNQDKNRYPNIIAFDHTRWPTFQKTLQHYRLVWPYNAEFSFSSEFSYHVPLSISQIHLLNAGSAYEGWVPERQRQRRRTNTWMPTMSTDSEGAELISPPRVLWQAPPSSSGGW